MSENAMVVVSGSVALTSLSEVERLAKVAHKGKFCGVTSPEDAALRILAGAELGMSPLQSIRAFYLLNGRPTLAADAMVGVVKARRDVCEYFRLVESTAELATYETKRVGDPEPTRLTFTIEQARRAKLVGKGPWQEHTEDMLRARAASKLARVVYSDLLNGLYTPDEAEDIKPRKRTIVVDAEAVDPAELAFADALTGAADQAGRDAVKAKIKASALDDEAKGRLRDLYESLREGP